MASTLSTRQPRHATPMPTRFINPTSTNLSSYTDEPFTCRSISPIMQQMTQSVRTRFAPSPTGFMHVGGVRTALFAWLTARQAGGQFILRIEDTDKNREVQGSIQHIIDSLHWLGLQWDEGVDIGGPPAPDLQNDRLDTYKKKGEKMLTQSTTSPETHPQKGMNKQTA